MSNWVCLCVYHLCIFEHFNVLQYKCRIHERISIKYIYEQNTTNRRRQLIEPHACPGVRDSPVARIAGAAQNARQYHILWLQCNTIAVQRAPVGVLHQLRYVDFGRLLQRGQRFTLDTQIISVRDVRHDFTHQSAERRPRKKHGGCLLQTTDLV